MNEQLKQDLKILQEKAISYGASATKVVDISTVKVGLWTRMKCQYGCPNFGSNLCCPPYAPSYDETQRFLSEYKYGIIVEYTIDCPEITANDFTAIDIQLCNDLLELLLKVEKDAFLANHYRAFSLKAGRCRLCDECNLKKCEHPTKARPSLEACGIDVFALANDNGFNMKVITGPITQLKIYGMVLIE